MHFLPLIVSANVGRRKIPMRRISSEASSDLLLSILLPRQICIVVGRSFAHNTASVGRIQPSRVYRTRRRINNLAADIMDRTAAEPAPYQACWESVPPPSLLSSADCTRDGRQRRRLGSRAATGRRRCDCKEGVTAVLRPAG